MQFLCICSEHKLYFVENVCHHKPTRWGAGEVGVSPAWKISGETLFSGQVQVDQKSWMIKIYLQCSELRARSVFQGKRKLFKNPEW